MHGPLHTTLLEITDDDFAWMLGERPAPAARLALPEDGIDAPEILRIVRGMTRRLHAAGCRGSWMMVCGNEVVGLCSYKQPPKDGVVEIGYGVAPAHRRRGHATRAVAAVLDYARGDRAVGCVTASTAVANVASQRALERNGFAQTGTGHDSEDGDLVFWSHDLS